MNQSSSENSRPARRSVFKGSQALLKALGGTALLALVYEASAKMKAWGVTPEQLSDVLSGEVRSEADRARATLLAQSQENVKDVVNDLTIGAPSSLTQRTKDTVITGQVKAAFLDAKDLQSNAVNVITERGVVYLMGRVTTREAQRATDIARGIGGVAKVVRVFEDISEEELKRLSQPPLGC